MIRAEWTNNDALSVEQVTQTDVTQCKYWDSESKFCALRRPVDAVERKKGKWIKAGDSSYRCSVCGFLLKWQREVCPNCGADMRKETEECGSHSR